MPEPKKPVVVTLFSRRMIVALLMGFSCGLPLLLTLGVLQAWMTEEGVDLTWVGMITLVQSPYSWKFLWAPSWTGSRRRFSAAGGGGCWSRNWR